LEVQIMDSEPERNFGAAIQVLPKPLFQTVLARTVRRKTEIPRLGATGADEAEAAEKIRAQLHGELEALRALLRRRFEQAHPDQARELFEQLLAIAPAEGLRILAQERRD
jgi:hypothetical protein